MSENYEKSCRICLTETGLISVHEKRNDSKTIAELIMDIANVTISFNDDYPQNVCAKCVSRIEIAFNLKVECENSDLKLQEIILGRKLMDLNNNFLFTDMGNGDSLTTPEFVETILKTEIDDQTLNTDEKIQIPDEQNNEDVKLSDVACEYCNEVFKNIVCLSNHMRKHKAITPHVCDVCGKKFRLRQHLTNHLPIHTGEKPFECDICSKKFAAPTNVYYHRRIHFNFKPYICDVCGKLFSTSSHLRDHNLSHVPIEERKFKCDKCNKTFRDRKVYGRHLKLHSGNRNEMCELCGKKFYNRSDVNRHHKTVHLAIKKYVCSVCSKAFSNSSNLESHIRIHTGEKPFHCKYCDMKFNQSTPLVKHTKIHLERGDQMRSKVY